MQFCSVFPGFLSVCTLTHNTCGVPYCLMETVVLKDTTAGAVLLQCGENSLQVEVRSV